VNKPTVCRCSAYEWPHRAGYGHCESPAGRLAYCSGCGLETGFHITPHFNVRSDCCQAPCLHLTTRHTLTIEDVPHDHQ